MILHLLIFNKQIMLSQFKSKSLLSLMHNLLDLNEYCPFTEEIVSYLTLFGLKKVIEFKSKLFN